QAFLANKTKGLPPCHPFRYPQEETYEDLLGPLRGKPTVWATCLFVDPIADIAVLGSPDNQALAEKSAAYDRLLDRRTALAIADAPAQGRERIKLRAFTGFVDRWIERKTPGRGSACVLSLGGRWLQGHVERSDNRLSFVPGRFFAGGMSGS